MHVEQSIHGAVTVLRPAGPLTREGAGEFRSEAEPTIRRSLGRCVIDASSVSYLDSEGIEALLDLAEGLARSGRELKLCGLSATVKEALQLTGVIGRFGLFEDVPSAVRSFL